MIQTTEMNLVPAGVAFVLLLAIAYLVLEFMNNPHVAYYSAIPLMVLLLAMFLAMLPEVYK